MGIILLLIGIVVVILGTVRLFIYHNKKKSYYTTDGIIIENRVDRYETISGGGYTHYYPVVQFTDKDGIVKELISSQYYEDRPGFDVGKKVKLLVNPQDSDRFTFDSKGEGYLISVLWIVIGIAAVVFSFVMPDK